MQTIKVTLANRSHEIAIGSGIIENAGALIRNAVGEKARKAVIVSNAKVDAYYGSPLSKSLRNGGFRVHKFLIGDGERYKNLRTAAGLYTFLIERRVERSDVVIALGGGVVGDLAGFVSGTYLRGVRIVQVPTTLLSQIDSSIGGKTAVNHPAGKNLIGVFHQPALVLIDPEALSTLPGRQIRAGLMEAIKYGVIRDRQLFEWIDRRIDRIKHLDSTDLSNLISRSCEIKARVVEEDERELGLRRILNFGHTVGHALEAVTKYRRFLHGEAVAHGMRAASRIAEHMGLLSAGDRRYIELVISHVGSLPNANSIALGGIISAMNHDKKAEGGRLSFVLPVEIGRVVVRSDVPPRVLTKALKSALG